jgi:hypothetical protein
MAHRRRSAACSWVYTMADYYPLIARAVARLAANTAETRRIVYMSARSALFAQLQGAVPKRSDLDINSERIDLETAIRKVEAESLQSALANCRLSKFTSKTFYAPDFKRWEAVTRWDHSGIQAHQPPTIAACMSPKRA